MCKVRYCNLCRYNPTEYYTSTQYSIGEIKKNAKESSISNSARSTPPTSSPVRFGSWCITSEVVWWYIRSIGIDITAMLRAAAPVFRFYSLLPLNSFLSFSFLCLALPFLLSLLFLLLVILFFSSTSSFALCRAIVSRPLSACMPTFSERLEN